MALCLSALANPGPGASQAQKIPNRLPERLEDIRNAKYSANIYAYLLSCGLPIVSQFCYIGVKCAIINARTV